MGRVNQGQTQSSQVEHDKTEGGTEGNPHADSLAASYTAPVQTVDGKTGDVTISVPIEQSSDVTHDNTSGGTSGNPHSGSASDNHGNDAENYTLKINGSEVQAGDTINFQT